MYIPWWEGSAENLLHLIIFGYVFVMVWGWCYNKLHPPEIGGKVDD